MYHFLIHGCSASVAYTAFISVTLIESSCEFVGGWGVPPIQKRVCVVSFVLLITTRYTANIPGIVAFHWSHWCQYYILSIWSE